MFLEGAYTFQIIVYKGGTNENMKKTLFYR